MPDTPQQSEAHEMLRSRWANLEFEGLSQPEKETVALFWLEGEVMNGGLIQFFANSSGDLSEYVSSGLSRLGCPTTLALFTTALAKLDLGQALESRDARIEALQPFFESATDPFEQETSALQSLPEDFFRKALDDLAARYSQGHV